MEKIEKIVELGIDIDNLENDEMFDDLGVDVISLVEAPAIEEAFLYFSKEKEQVVDLSCSAEGPEEVEEMVDEVLKWAEENGIFANNDDVIVDLSKEEFSTIADVLSGLSALDLMTRLNIKKGEQSETYYRYQGPSAERKFCKAMLNLANRGKMFTKEQIDEMNGLNPQFARSGDSTYPVFQWVGGKNCRHYWQKLEVFKNEDNKRVIIVSDPTNNSQRLASKTWNEKMSSEQYHFEVTSEDQRILTGAIMIPNKMILRRDEDGTPFYVYFSESTVAKMAEKFLEQNKQHNTDIDHDGNVTTTNKLIESWVSASSTYDKSYQMGFALPKGTWFASFRIHDDETWSKVKSGEIKGFSLAGNFINRFEPING